MVAVDLDPLSIDDQEPWTAGAALISSPAISSETVTLLEEIAGFRGRWVKLRELEPERLAALRRVATIESVASSTRIEGAVVSDDEVEKIVSGLTIDSFRTRDEAEVRGYAELLTLIFENVDSLRLTENHIKQMHSILLEHVPKDASHRGEYKRVPNDVTATWPDGTTRVIFRPASPADTILMMPRLVEETQAALQAGEISTVAVIADFVLCFLAIHPFRDGNGRLSRALTTMLLLQEGHEYVPFGSLERVIEDNKTTYYAELRRSQSAIRRDASNYDPWLSFFCRALIAQQRGIASRVSHARTAAVLPAALRKLLDYVSAHGRATTAEIVATTGESDRTVRARFAQLVDRGLLVAEGASRKSRVYTTPLLPPATDLNRNARHDVTAEVLANPKS